MPTINLLNESEPSKSTDESSASMINMYLAGGQDAGKYQVNAYPTPGTTVFSTIMSPVRASYSEHGVYYVVGGNKFYSIDSAGVSTVLGTLNTSTGFAKIRGINNELFIIDGTNGYYYIISTNTFAVISSTTYVSNISMTNPGNGYTNPTAVIFDSIGSGAVGTVLIQNGQIIQITVTAGGTGYANPTITIAGGSGSGATAFANVSGGIITNIVLSNSGFGYTSPIITITDSAGTGGTATATATAITPGTPLTNLTLVTGGTLYVSPVVQILDSAGVGATASITFSGGIVTSITLTNAGSGYLNPVVAIYDSTATGTGATATPTLTGGQVGGAPVIANGSGYTAPIALFYDPTGTGATGIVQVTTSTFTDNVIDNDCQDEFGLAVKPNSQIWYSSAISDITTWPVISFASTTGNQNNIVAIVSIHREIWLFGSQNTEVWYNAGTTFFTWARRPDVFIEYGCAAKQSVAKGDNTVFCLGQSPTGGPVVVRMNGYSPVVISTPSINYAISTYSTVSDAIGFVYQQEGHEFYVLTFPTAGVTWVYDIATQAWHQRQSDISGNQTRWLASCYAYCYSKQLIGDYNSGNIYQLDMSQYLENSNPITRTIVTAPYYQAGVQIYCDKLQIDFDQTPGAELSEITLYVSRDGGNTFGVGKPAIPVQTSDGQWRCYWNRLGRSRTWVLKIVTTMNNKFLILGAWANFRAGGN